MYDYHYYKYNRNTFNIQKLFEGEANKFYTVLFM